MICTIQVKQPQRNMRFVLLAYRGIFGWQVERETPHSFRMGRNEKTCETPQEVERVCEELRKVLDSDARIESFNFQSRDTLEELT